MNKKIDLGDGGGGGGEGGKEAETWFNLALSSKNNCLELLKLILEGWEEGTIRLSSFNVFSRD